MREQLRQLDPDLPLLDVRPLDWLVSGTRFGNRVFATVFGIAAGLSLLLAAVGLHAITAYAIRQRTHEIGVRMALGARPSQVVWLFVRRTLTPLAWGLVIGLAGAFGVGRFVQGMLIQTSPHDPATLSAITADTRCRRSRRGGSPGAARGANRSRGGVAFRIGSAAPVG